MVRRRSLHVRDFRATPPRAHRGQGADVFPRRDADRRTVLALCRARGRGGGMTEFPQGLRLARKGDEDRLFALFCVAHAENGYGDIDEPHVRAIIARGCCGDGVVIAMADGPERIEAVLGLHPDKRWYSTPDKPENYYHTELLLYVHPLHRRSRHAAELFQFAKYWEEYWASPLCSD